MVCACETPSFKHGSYQRKKRLKLMPKVLRARQLLPKERILRMTNQHQKSLKKLKKSVLRKKSKTEPDRKSGTHLMRRPSSTEQMKIARKSLLFACRTSFRLPNLKNFKNS